MILKIHNEKKSSLFGRENEVKIINSKEERIIDR